MPKRTDCSQLTGYNIIEVLCLGKTDPMLKKLLFPFTCALLLTACHADSRNAPAKTTAGTIQTSPATMTSEITLTIGKKQFPVTLNDTQASQTIRKMLPLTLNMTEFNGNEKYADLPQSLPTNSFTPDAIRTGDIMLFGSRTLVMFYQDFQTSYAYTRIGRIKDTKGLAEALGRGNVNVTLDF